LLAEIEPLMRFARTLTRDLNAAEDLVHDALVRAYEKRHLFNADASLRTWLFAVLHSVFISSARRRLAEVQREQVVFELSSKVAPPSQEHTADLQRVQQALHVLPTEQRSVLHLVAIEGLSYREAAAALDVPVGTIMSRLARGRAALRDLLERREIPSETRLHVLRRNDES
jgi:RNA polymerase sigma factor (sigma-70 family)